MERHILTVAKKLSYDEQELHTRTKRPQSLKGLQQEIDEQERQTENLEQFIQRVKKNSDLTLLTPYALRELVGAVYVEAPDKSSGKRKQKIHVCYDLIGYIPVDVLLKAEQA